MQVRPRTVALVASVLLGIAGAMWIVYLSRQVIVWMLVTLCLAMLDGLARPLHDTAAAA